MNTAIRNRIPEEQLADSAGDPTKARWSNVESLLATLIDEMRSNTWAYMQSQTDKAIPRPEPIARPGVGSGRKLRKISLASARKIDPRLRDLDDIAAQAMLNRMTGRGN